MVKSKYIQKLKKVLLSQLRGINESDCLQVSFPKTGSTFTRYVFSNYISLAYHDGMEVTFHNLGDLLPEIGKDDLTQPWNYQGFPRIIKTHDEFSKKYEALLSRTIYVLRDPRDTMLSFHPYISKRKEANYSGTFSEFIENDQYGIKAYNRHVEGWLDHADFVFRYEDLMTNAYDLFSAFFNKCSVEFNPEWLTEAIARSQPGSVKKIENDQGIPGFENKYKDGFTFVRNAKIDQWKTEMPEEHQQRIMHLASTAFADLGYQ